MKPGNARLLDAIRRSRRIGGLRGHGSRAREALIGDLYAGQDPNPDHLAMLIDALVLEVEGEARDARRARRLGLHRMSI